MLAACSGVSAGYRAFPDAQPSSCATVVYLRVGPDKYQAYSLLGGP